ncbi:MAG TPA: hypothetical protein PLW10_21160, partial [Myxococcota bacterium]|nr:hypothetical protein [Myxococcota bacterium]
MSEPQEDESSILGRVVDLFLSNGTLPPILIAVSLLAGAWALWATPREEEPQIVVPVVDVHDAAPGL